MLGARRQRASESAAEAPRLESRTSSLAPSPGTRCDGQPPSETSLTALLQAYDRVAVCRIA